MNTKVIVMSGISGSGKSTVVKGLISEASVVCSADHFFMKDDKYIFNPRLLGEAHAQCLREFTDLLVELHESSYIMADVIVVDNTNLTAIEMAPYVALAIAYGAKVEIITVICLPEVAFERNVHGVPLASIRRMRDTLLQRKLPAYWNVSTCEVNTNPPEYDLNEPTLALAHRKIAMLPVEKQHEAMRRMSRSYSAGENTLRIDGCHFEGGEVVWPDGERFPRNPQKIEDEMPVTKRDRLLPKGFASE